MTRLEQRIADAAKLTPLMAQARLAELTNMRDWAVESARWESIPNVAKVSADIDAIEEEMYAIKERLAELESQDSPARVGRRSLADVETDR